MVTNHDLYQCYTSTSSLVPGSDEKAAIAWSERYFRAHYSKVLPADKSVRLLEVGCGYGKYIKALQAIGYIDCYGIDLSPEQVSYAHSVLGLSNVEQADAIDWLDGYRGAFDCILALDVLEHFENDDLVALAKKIFMALKPGGVAIFQVPNGMSPINPIPYGDLTHVRAFTPQSMQQLLLNAGFVTSAFYELPPFFHGFQSAIRKALWVGVIKPAIAVFVRLLHGKVIGGDIYTSNFMAVARRDLDDLYG